MSPVALFYRERSLEESLALSDRVTAIAHDHPEGIKVARAVTEGTWLALRGIGADGVRREITTRYGYDLKPSVEDIRPSHRFEVTCQGMVPTALICAFESTSLEDAVRNAVSPGGGAVGEALHGLPEGLLKTMRERCLRDVLDITGAHDSLYERATCEVTPETHCYESDRTEPLPRSTCARHQPALPSIPDPSTSRPHPLVSSIRLF